jgi:hypothetical protein
VSSQRASADRLPLDEPGIRELAATLKQRCGTGGTVKDGRIEIQGDQRERIVAELEKLGYKARRRVSSQRASADRLPGPLFPRWRCHVVPIIATGCPGNFIP